MRVGIDSYSYHRRYGEIRLGEQARREAPWPRLPGPVLEHARSVGADAIFLETCYLPEPEDIDAATLSAAGSVEVGFSWGHPWPEGAFHGLEGGNTPAAEDHLARWIALCDRLGMPLMRITLSSPAARGTEPGQVLVDRSIDPVRRAADRAATVGLSLAIENHGDLRAAEIVQILERVDRPNLGVTLDTVNLPRVGDDMLEGAALLAPYVLLVQMKDHVPTPDFTIDGGAVCTALGEGVAPLVEVIAILEAAGYSGVVCVELASLGPGGDEVDELAMVARSVGWLREHVPAG
jgi:sugar phosphate isomerase/epimerase